MGRRYYHTKSRRSLMVARRHGLGNSNDPLYCAWVQMRTRCNNPNNKDYANYGGRGITVCPEWDVFEAFAADVGPHPGKGWSIDRVDNGAGYCRDNVRWSNITTQNRNRRLCKINLALAETIREEYGPISTVRNWSKRSRKRVTIALLAKKYGVSAETIRRIIHRRIWVP